MGKRGGLIRNRIRDLREQAGGMTQQELADAVGITRQTLINDIGLIMTMVSAGGGVALLPSYLCRQACDEGRLVPVLPEWHGKADPIHIVYPRQRCMPPRLRAFVDLATLALRQWLE